MPTYCEARDDIVRLLESVANMDASLARSFQKPSKREVVLAKWTVSSVGAAPNAAWAVLVAVSGHALARHWGQH
jgi:hypothetical protein